MGRETILEYIVNLEDMKINTKSVMSFALPSKRVMIKIMRACISVDDPKKLWIYYWNLGILKKDKSNNIHKMTESIFCSYDIN